LARLAAAALVAVGMMAKPAYAWDELGHRVVARIAWDNMTPAARANAVRLLMAAPANSGLRELAPAGVAGDERGRELFVMAAVWPDIIRSRSYVGNRYAHGDWHYVNFFWEQRFPGGPVIPRPDKPLDGHLLDQLPGLASTVGSAQAGDSARSVALAWVLHLVGDAHQPLHNSARITPQDTVGDRGGNLFLLAGLYPRNNLHAYWDSLVGFSVPWLGGGEAEYVGRIASRVSGRYTRGWARSRLHPGEFRGWSQEGVRVAQQNAYPAWLARGQAAPARYQELTWGAAQPRIALAGYRLADLLNRSLAGS